MTAISCIPPVLLGLAVAVLLLHAGPVFPSVSPAVDPHAHFRQPGQCPRCHLDSGSKKEPGRIATASVEFCLECHRLEGLGATHPLKVRPGDRYRGIAVPPDTVLSGDGKIVCLTCHTAHGPAGNHFLRRSDPEESGHRPVCDGCHKTP